MSQPPPLPPAPRPMRTLLKIGGILGPILLLFILFCSGLNIPVIAPQSSFARSIREDFNVELPASLKVVRAARCAMRDPAYHYECDMPATEVLPFMQRLGFNADRVSEERRFSFGPPPPAWYTPASLPDRQSHITARYWFFFSPSTGKIFVFWYAT